MGPLFRTAPEPAARPRADSRHYLNTVVVGTSRLGPEELLAELKRVEHRRGRRRGARNAPRPLDLDLLLYGDLLVDRPELTVPHPRLEQRPFALAPLAALTPDWPVPPSGDTVESILARHGGAETLESVPWPAGVLPSSFTQRTRG